LRGGPASVRWAMLGVVAAFSGVAPVQQSYLLQARQMQALSFAVHIPLVCFGIAFPAVILVIEWRYLRTGDEVYKTLARRWTKVLVTLFAAGVVTGTILSFEMGLLWPDFTSTFGSVFGLGFAVDGLMNHPQGFRLVDGRVTDVHPVRALFGNTYFWHELVHMYLAGYIVTGFLVAGAYAIARLRGRWGRYERIALAVPLTAAAVAAPLQVLVGDWAARDVGREQPIKLAALEGLGATTPGAPVHLLGWYTDGRVDYGIEIPKLLSFLAFHSPNATVTGLNAFPAGDLPPVNVVRIAFQLMVGIGTLLALLSLAFLLVRWR